MDTKFNRGDKVISNDGIGVVKAIHITDKETYNVLLNNKSEVNNYLAKELEYFTLDEFDFDNLKTIVNLENTDRWVLVQSKWNELPDDGACRHNTKIVVINNNIYEKLESCNKIKQTKNFYNIKENINMLEIDINASIDSKLAKMIGGN